MYLLFCLVRCSFESLSSLDLFSIWCVCSRSIANVRACVRGVWVDFWVALVFKCKWKWNSNTLDNSRINTLHQAFDLTAKILNTAAAAQKLAHTLFKLNLLWYYIYVLLVRQIWTKRLAIFIRSSHSHSKYVLHFELQQRHTHEKKNSWKSCCCIAIEIWGECNFFVAQICALTNNKNDWNAHNAHKNMHYCMHGARTFAKIKCQSQWWFFFFCMACLGSWYGRLKFQN